MEAVDYKYRYRLERPDNITGEQWEEERGKAEIDIHKNLPSYGLTEENYIEDLQHVLVQETCRRLGLSGYERRRYHDA